MKITISHEFNFEGEYTDEYEYETIRNASKYRSALGDIYQYLRQQWKYVEFETEKEHELIDKVYEQFFELLSENGISGDDIG